jgi:hypothetical protein
LLVSFKNGGKKMRKVKIIFLSENEREYLKNQYSSYNNAVNSLDKFKDMEGYVEAEFNKLKNTCLNIEAKIREVENQSYLIIKNVGNEMSKNFDGIEEMVQYANLINRFKECHNDFIELADSDIDLLKKIFSKAVDEKIVGGNMEKFVQVYNTFKI